jgi:outer membrane protein OmpA-like peptidoglycan-associated protein
VIVAALLVASAMLGSWLSDLAREEAAAAAGIPLERVEADGLDITLTGFTDEAERDQAVAAVENLDSSWAVIGLMAPDAAADAASDATADGDDGAPGDGDSEDVATPVTVELRFEGSGRVIVRGTVPDDDLRITLADQAIFHFGTTRVSNEVSVEPTGAPGGGVGPDGGRLAVAGTATSPLQAQEWLEAAHAIADEVGFDVVDEVTVTSLPDALNALVELEPIEFDELRSTVRPDSLAVLDRAAELINAHPEAGVVRVVGHTDSDGRAARNLALSLRRAQAVVDYLTTQAQVDPSRLEAVGAGEEQLLISPELTANDKQRNRRIEWEVSS